MAGLRKFLLPLGFNTRYTLHTCDQVDLDYVEQILKSDRPLFKGVERAVPASSVSRFANFAWLGGSLVAGSIFQGFRTGFTVPWKELMVNEGNIEKLTEGLLKMRGAALKIGQFISFQDTQKMPPSLIKAMEKTRREAYIMPAAQLQRVLREELGENWASTFDEFDMMPFAAASIGQVHKAKYKGIQVAVKIQYPGIDKSINSDLNNLHNLFTWTNVLPRGLFFDALVDHSRQDLINECDYLLEAESQLKFTEILKNEKGISVPKVFKEISTKHILVTEFIDSLVFEDICAFASQSTRDSIGTRIMMLTVKEIFEYKFMQTDPNPANFQYCPKTDKLQLLDFGACKSYSDAFVNKYRLAVMAGVNKEKEKALQYLKALGFILGDEHEELLDAHVASIIAVGEPFSHDHDYDFGSQNITPQVYKQLPTMMEHRKIPPPPETYSIHRKLSGAFLLCMKLRARVPTRKIYEEYIRA